MSLVGTRPPTLDEWEKYELHHRARLAIKPGIDEVCSADINVNKGSALKDPDFKVQTMTTAGTYHYRLD